MAIPMVPKTMPNTITEPMPRTDPRLVIVRDMPNPRNKAQMMPQVYVKIVGGSLIFLSSFIRVSNSVSVFSVYSLLILFTKYS